MKAGRRRNSRKYELRNLTGILREMWKLEVNRRKNHERRLPELSLTREHPDYGLFPTITGKLAREIEVHDLQGISDPLGARLAIGLSQAEMGIVLSVWGRTYQRSTICKWEQVGITQSKKNPHKITSKGRRAYREFLNLIVKIVAGKDYYIKSRMWRGPWKIEIKQYKG